MTPDKGHTTLVNDLKSIAADAENFEFHDFKNTSYAAPKMTLVAKLEEIIKNTKEGFYDN